MRKQKLNHKCIICGAMYHSCDNCAQIKTYTPWRTMCDTFEHYSIYLIMRSYQNEIISKDEAQKELLAMKFNKGLYANWPDNVKAVLDEIFAENAEPEVQKIVEVTTKQAVKATTSKSQKKDEE